MEPTKYLTAKPKNHKKQKPQRKPTLTKQKQSKNTGQNVVNHRIKRNSSVLHYHQDQMQTDTVIDTTKQYSRINVRFVVKKAHSPSMVGKPTNA